jgi:HAD superfamily hydrolase (TIGR01509 family)
MTRLAGVGAVTFDFGNTLVPVDRAGLARVVQLTAAALTSRCGPFEEEDFLSVWAQERERQFAEEVPQLREVDLEQRVVRVLARLRGMTPPQPGVRWDDAAARRCSSPDELTFAVDVYSRAFVEAMPPPPEVGPLLTALARDHRLAVLSNWPLAVTIDRYVEAAGWAPSLVAVIVSQRIGVIKPHPRIFGAARAALGGPPARAILHVGDDWAADVQGARAAGWRAAWVRSRPADSPLPASVRGDDEEADLEIDELSELVEALGPC